MTEAEVGVIGCVLISNEALYEVYDKLKPQMFSSEFCQDCFSIMLALYDRGKNINVISLSQELENHKWTQEIISEELRDCITAAPASVMIKSYAETVIRDYKSRTVKQLFQNVSLKPCDIDDTIAEILLRFEELQQSRERSLKPLKQIVEENSGRYFNDSVGEGGIKTGFYKLDDCLGNLEGGDVTIIGARPAVGKSALVTQMIGQMAAKGHRTAYFNLEMNESQVYERFVSRLAELSLTRIRRAKAFLGGEKEAFDRANKQMSQYDVMISTGSKTVGEIRAISRHQQFDIIIIDYLQLIKADRRFNNRASEVGEISKAIKALATELKIPIILLSQLNRLSEQKETKEPTMAELRESGDIEQDASNIILLWNMSENRKYKGLKVEKQRQGEPMKEGLEFDGDHMKFIERQESFDRFQSYIKQLERSKNDFSVTDDSPFDSWGG